MDSVYTTVNSVSIHAAACRSVSHVIFTLEINSTVFPVHDLLEVLRSPVIDFAKRRGPPRRVPLRLAVEVRRAMQSNRGELIGVLVAKCERPHLSIANEPREPGIFRVLA